MKMFDQIEEKSRYFNEKAWVYNQCLAYIDSLSSPLHEVGTSYFQGYSKSLHAVKGWELPFWLGESFGVDNHVCRKIALSNVFGGMHIHIVDEVMDSDDHSGPDLLSIGTLFYFRSIQLYQALFSLNSEFWCFLEKYLREWSDAVLWERQNHRFKMQPYDDSDLLRLAKKAAPIKWCCAATSLLANVPNFIDDIEKAIDYVYAAIEVTDCLIDAHIDLDNKCYSYVLMKIAQDMKITDPQQFDHSSIDRALYATDVIDFVVDKAVELSHTSISIISPLRIIGLQDFLEENISNLEAGMM